MGGPGSVCVWVCACVCVIHGEPRQCVCRSGLHGCVAPPPSLCLALEPQETHTPVIGQGSTVCVCVCSCVYVCVCVCVCVPRPSVWFHHALLPHFTPVLQLHA